MARVRKTGGETGDGAGARILAAVRSALIGRAGLARRPRYTAGERAALTREEKKACSGIGIAAVRQVPEDVYDQIDELGRLRYEPAVPSLIEVREHCPGHMAVVKAGHARSCRARQRCPASQVHSGLALVRHVGCTRTLRVHSDLWFPRP